MAETLRIFSAPERLELASSVEAVFASSRTTALLYGGRSICIALGSAEEFVCGTERIDLADVYQADVFAEETTLAWRRTADQTGTAIVLSFKTEAPYPSAWGDPVVVDDGFHIDQQHLIWGQAVTEPADGWTRLTAARIGGLSVPLAVPAQHKAVLHAKAWFRPLPEACGNPRFIGRTWGPFKAKSMRLTAGAPK